MLRLLPCSLPSFPLLSVPHGEHQSHHPLTVAWRRVRRGRISAQLEGDSTAQH